MVTGAPAEAGALFHIVSLTGFLVIPSIRYLGMYFQLLFAIALLCISSMQVQASPQAQTAIKLSFNEDWQFQKSPAHATAFQPEAKAWEKVSLPHTPKLEPLLVNDQWQGIALYQKQFNAPKSWQGQRLYLRFEGAMNHTKVWLNDKPVGEHLGGYLPFSIDISAAVNYGADNQLRVALDNNDNPITGPKPLHLLDFNTYGGLYRDVNLFIKAPLHISDEMLTNLPNRGGLVISSKIDNKAKASVAVQADIRNQGSKAAQFTLKQVLEFDGKAVATTAQSFTLAANSQQVFSQNLTVKQPKLWHPTHPNLYQLQTELWQGNTLLERSSNKVGIREFAFNAKHELLINGEPYFLRGINRHQDYPHVGYATSKQADYRDAIKIKEAGFDYVRLSHYPHSPAFMDAADEVGLVLIDAVLGWQYFSPEPEFAEHVYQSCRDLLRRDRNHASVLAWECSLNETPMPVAFIDNLKAIIQAELPGAMSAGWQTQYDIYLQARQHRMQHYQTPTQPYNVSEYGDWEYYAQNAGLNQQAWADLKDDERTSRQLLGAGEKRLLQQAMNLQEAHNDNLHTPAFADGYWVMFDYNRGYANDLESSGIMSIYRQPKFSYYLFQSQRDPALTSTQYNAGPMVYIASDWQADSSPNVRVFSNADAVDLWLNGKLIARQTPDNGANTDKLPHPPFTFHLPSFEAGELSAKAFIGNQLVATHSVRTPQAIHALEISLDTAGVPINSAGSDVLFVNVRLVDANGTTVPVNDKVVSFEVNGAIQVLNPDAIVTEKGVASALVRVHNGAKGAHLKASFAAENTAAPLTAELKF